MSTLSRDSYHHGDLRTALLATARAMLETSPSISLRALAKETGVSPTAVYRHFADKRALESALAAQGYQELLAQLREVKPKESETWRLGYSYVAWAEENQPLFNLMFTTDCDPMAPERVKAVDALTEYISDQLQRLYPERFSEQFVTTIWGLVHGLTTLYLQKKIFADDGGSLEEQMRDAWNEMI